MSETNATQLNLPPRLDLVERFLQLQPARTIEVGDFTYIDKDKNVTLFMPPEPHSLQLDTLSGFVKLLENSFEKFPPQDSVVHVSDFNEVSLIANFSDKWGRRQVYLTAKAPKPERSFPFNQFLSQELFNINLRSMFVEDDALRELLGISGNLTDKSEVNQKDDGFTQDVTVKGGVQLMKRETISPRMTLRPFRTFLEVEQPEGDYLFRVKGDGEKGLTCALIEADAGRWKLKAMETIAKWLETRLKTSDRAELGNLPVVA